MHIRFDEPCYIISVVTRLVGLHPQTIRYYERAGLLNPWRSRGNVRLYSHRDVERIRYIKSLIDDLGVNLAGVEVILRMTQRMSQMENEISNLREALGSNHRNFRRD